LDTVVGALRELPEVHLDRLPRMADFARLAVAAERGRGEPPTVLAAYAGLREASHQQALDGSVIGGVLLAFLDVETRSGHWRGTAEELLTGINDQADGQTTRSRYWPKTPRALSSELRRLAPALRGVGFTVSLGEREGGTGRRLISIGRTSAPPPSPHEGADEGAVWVGATRRRRTRCSPRRPTSRPR